MVVVFLNEIGRIGPAAYCDARSSVRRLFRARAASSAGRLRGRVGVPKELDREQNLQNRLPWILRIRQLNPSRQLRA